MSKLDQIKVLADIVDGPLPHRMDADRDRVVFKLEVTKLERNLIADALTVLYGVEKRAAETAGMRQEKL